MSALLKACGYRAARRLFISDNKRDEESPRLIASCMTDENICGDYYRFRQRGD